MTAMKLLAKKRYVTCYCDFCDKSDDEVSKMVNGKHAFICDQCIEAARKFTQPQLGSR
jgi:ATP-dependent protease Clp ATPase subunit